jgi:hypothetical protein
MGAVQRQKGAVHPSSKWGMCADTVRTQKPRVPGAAALTGAVLDKTLASNTHPLKRLLERDQLFSRSGCLGLATLYCALFALRWQRRAAWCLYACDLHVTCIQGRGSRNSSSKHLWPVFFFVVSRSHAWRDTGSLIPFDVQYPSMHRFLLIARALSTRAMKSPNLCLSVPVQIFNTILFHFFAGGQG